MQALGRRRSRLGILVAATAAGTLLIGAVFFTRSDGSLVRGPLFSFVEQRYGVVATARRFDLDPLRLRVAAGGLELAARDHADEPFLQVEEVVVDLPWTAVWGGPAIDTLFLDGPALSVVRHADGSSNLPAGGPETFVAAGSAEDSDGAALSGGEGDAPAPDLPIRRLDVRNLAVDWRDEASGLAVRLPAAEVYLADAEDVHSGGGDPRGSETGEAPRFGRGKTNTSGTAGVSWRGIKTGVLSFDGELAYNGSALRIDRLTVTSAEGELTIHGLVDVLLGRPRMKIDYEARFDLSHLAAWVLGAAASGAVAVAGSLQRVADRFELSAKLGGGAVKWGRAALDRFDAALAVAPDGATVESLHLELAGGVLSASGGVDFAAGLPGWLEATWSGFDIDRLLALRGSVLPIAVEAVATGSLSARWTEFAPQAVDLSARNRFSTDAPGAAVGADLRLQAEDGRWRLTADGALGSAAHLSGNLEAEVAAGGAGSAVDWRAARLAGDIVIHCEDVAACGPTDATLGGLRGSATARFAVSGSLGRPEVTGVVEAPVLRIGRGALAGFTAHLAADPDAVRVTVPPVAVGPNQLRGGAEVRLIDNTVEGFLAADLADLAFLGPVVPPALAPSGRGRIDATVGGRLGQPRGDAVFGFDALEIGGQHLGPVTGWVRGGSSGRLQAALEIPDLAVSVEAEAGPAGEGSFEIRGQMRDADLARLVPPAASLAVSVTGRVTGDISAAGTLADLSPASTATGMPGAVELAGDVRIDDGSLLVGEHPPLTGVQVRASVRDGVVLLDELRAAWGGAEIQGKAELPLGFGAAWLPAALMRGVPTHGRSARVRASVASLSPAVLEAYVVPALLDDIAGGVSAVLDLEVPARGIEGSRGRLTLTEAAFEVSGVPVAQRRPTVIAVENGRAVLTAFDWGSQGNVVGMGGSLQLADLRADGWAEGNLDLRALSGLVPQLAAAGVGVGGTARLRARLTGPFDAAALRGSLEIAKGEMRVAEPRLAITDLDGALSLDGDSVTVDHLTGTANGGRVRIDGGWRIGGMPDEKRIAVTGTGIALDFPPGLRTEADLALAIQEEDGLALTGSATVLRGAYREPITLAGGLIEALRRGSATGPVVSDGETTAGVRLDVRVSTGEDLVVDNNYVEAEVGGDLRIGGTTAAPSLAGRIALREGGRVRLGNRAYEIDTGTVDFVDPEGIAPELTLTARTRAGGYDITLDVSGSPDDLTTQLRSEPPLPESDIASVLLTGRPLGRSEALSGAGDQVLGLASTELLGQAGRGVGLDLQVGPGTPDAEAEIRFDSSLVSTDLNPASRLTVGRDLRDDVRLVFSRSLRENDLVWFVDYLPRSDVELRAFFDDEDRRAYEFRHAVSSGARTRGARRPASRLVLVSDVAVVGDPGLDAEPLRERLSLRPGDPFDFHRQQRDRDRLLAALHERGFLEARVQTRREPGPNADGVVLTYEIVHGPRTALAVTGYDPPEDVRRDLEAIWAQAVFDTFLLDELEARVAEHLRDRGYLRAAVDARIVERSGAPPGQSAREAAAAVDGGPGAKRIDVGVDPGPRTDERRLRFEGVGTEDVRALERVVRKQDLDRPAWNDPERLETAIAAWYRDRGRLRATVEIGEPRFVGRSAELTVHVAPGPLFRFGAVELAGTLARPAAEVRAEAAIEEGAVYSESAVAAARARILASYRRAGHTEATVTARRTIDESAAAVDVRFEVSEGPRQVVREVVVEGARRTHPALVRKALDIEPGAPVDPAAWSLARKRLYDTGVFRSVDIEAVVPAGAEARAAETTIPVEARVLLEEWPRYRFRYGLRLVDDAAALGESTGRALRLGAVGDLNRRNLWGRGLTGGVSTRAGRDQQALRAYLRMPTLLGRPIETNLFVSRRRETDHASGIGTIDVTQITAEQRIRPRAGTMLAVSASLDRSRTSDGVPLPESLDTAGWNVARIDGSAVVDTRNNLFDPSSGFYHSSNLTYGAEIGNPRAFLKYLGQQFVHRRVGQVVLASAVRVGLATGLGAELMPTERFFAGGGNTVRGYAQDSLGPGGPGPGGIPAGGHALLILNQEVRVPLWKRFGAVGFIDAGNVFRSVRTVSLRDLRVGAGFGLRFQSPVGLLRLDYGFALPRRPDEPRGRFFVSLGQAF